MEYSLLFVALMGMGTVFFGLTCLIFLTLLIGRLLGGAESAATAAIPPGQDPDQAVIAAIIAAVTEAMGPGAAHMEITDIRKIQ